MRIAVDIDDGELKDAIRFTKAKTRGEAILLAVADFNRRRRMAELTRYAGTCQNLMTPEELQAARTRS